MSEGSRSSDAEGPSTPPAEFAPSRWGAFGRPAFAAIWGASVLLNIGVAMFDTAAAWLMTNLNADPAAVSMVQVAVSLPIFLITLPAGAFADIIDPRRFLPGGEPGIILLAIPLPPPVPLHPPPPPHFP